MNFYSKKENRIPLLFPEDNRSPLNAAYSFFQTTSIVCDAFAGFPSLPPALPARMVFIPSFSPSRGGALPSASAAGFVPCFLCSSGPASASAGVLLSAPQCPDADRQDNQQQNHGCPGDSCHTESHRRSAPYIPYLPDQTAEPAAGFCFASR